MFSAAAVGKKATASKPSSRRVCSTSARTSSTLVAATLAGPAFPRYVLLLPQDTITGFFVVMGICLLASLVSIRLALKVDPAEAVGG